VGLCGLSRRRELPLYGVLTGGLLMSGRRLNCRSGEPDLWSYGSVFMGPREPISFDPSPHIPLQQTTVTADFSVIDPYRKMRAAGSAEKSNRPIVYAWCVRVNINANRCEKSA
jgi:hypothetical protein